MDNTKPHKRAHDSVHWFMNELSSRIISESGIPSDRYHLGKLILQSLKDAPYFVMQIDGATNESETNKSVMNRSVRCAVSLKNLGLQTNDVICLIAPNHIDLAIPWYAALYLGIAIAAVDVNSTVRELGDSFTANKPNIIFCQSEKVLDIQNALKNIKSKAQIITFDKSNDVCNFHDLLKNYGDDNAVEEFKLGLTEYPTPTRMALVVSPIQWLSAGFNFLLSPILRYVRLQSSQPISKESIYHLVNTYRPTFTSITPTFMTTLLKAGDFSQCDFTCFEQILLAGSVVSSDIFKQIKNAIPKAILRTCYGLSEVGGYTFYDDFPTPGCLGKPIGCFSYRLVDVETQQDIYEPNVTGELWLKGPTVFKGYYNNAEATAETFQGDWLKTGDLLYRDEHWNFYFVDRLKLMLKYKSHQISPVELETVIRQHPGVQDVAVTGVPEPECGELPVACVVPRPGCTLTAQEIKDLVKESLAESKQLRGGVIFMTKLPTTVTTKVDRQKLKKMVLELDRE